MPGGVHQSVNDSRGKNRSALAPGPAVKESRDRRENHVTPVGEPKIGDVRETEQDRSGPPAGKLALARARQQILQQPAKQKFLRPRRKAKNRNGDKDE